MVVIGRLRPARRDEAGIDQFAVDHYGACAALAFAAAFFRACQTQVFAQYVEKAGHRRGVDRVLAIHHAADRATLEQRGPFT